MKGATAQAVQNLNVMLGFEEQEGLDYLPMFP
jgi:N-acetyl-gamma-glutamyl-phosphate reductase